MGNFHICLNSLFIGHGILDLLILGKRIDYLFWYLGIIILYNLLLVLCHELFLSLFIVLSGYHFGVDFKFITNDTTNLSIFTGWFFISFDIISLKVANGISSRSSSKFFTSCCNAFNTVNGTMFLYALFKKVNSKKLFLMILK